MRFLATVALFALSAVVAATPLPPADKLAFLNKYAKLVRHDEWEVRGDSEPRGGDWEWKRGGDWEWKRGGDWEWKRNE